MLAVGVLFCLFRVRIDVPGTRLAVDVRQTAPRSVIVRYVHIGARFVTLIPTGKPGLFDSGIARLMYRRKTSLNID